MPERGPREEAEGKVPSCKQGQKDSDPSKLQAQQQPKEKRRVGILPACGSHAINTPREG